jgi:hypothetical protein
LNSSVSVPPVVPARRGKVRHKPARERACRMDGEQFVFMGP